MFFILCGRGLHFCFNKYFSLLNNSLFQMPFNLLMWDTILCSSKSKLHIWHVLIISGIWIFYNDTELSRTLIYLKSYWSRYITVLFKVVTLPFLEYSIFHVNKRRKWTFAPTGKALLISHHLKQCFFWYQNCSPPQWSNHFLKIS